MPGTSYNIEYYVADNGKAPFIEWLGSLKDRAAVARIIHRIDRVRLGNFGVFRSVGDGVFELKFDIGPGYRVYYALTAVTCVLLLAGGSKRTQTKNIATAKEYWHDYQRR